VFSRLARLSAVLIALALVGCPKQKPPPPEPPTERPPERPAVGIDAVKPAGTTEGRGVTVTLEGWGFLDGAKVFLGSREARGVDVVSADEMTFRAAEDLPVGTYDIRVELPTDDQAVARQAFEVRKSRADSGDCTLQTVYFAFDESALDNPMRQVLEQNAQCIEARGFKTLRLEGHCDERGDTVYNLSLGQRRADSVRKYLENLGVDTAGFQTVSYGEEAPIARGYGEEAWSKNRRVEFKVD
jgi:peptidoglycan-associated lipoprotein